MHESQSYLSRSQLASSSPPGPCASSFFLPALPCWRKPPFWSLDAGGQPPHFPSVARNSCPGGRRAGTARGSQPASQSFHLLSFLPPLDPPSLCCVIPMLMLSPDLPCYRLTPCRPESGSAHACAECAGRSIRWGRTFRAGDRGTRGCALAQASKFWVLAWRTAIFFFWLVSYTSNVNPPFPYSCIVLIIIIFCNTIAFILSVNRWDQIIC